MARKLIRWTIAVLGALILAAGGALAWAMVAIGRHYRVPPVPILRATAPAQLARGETLFRAACADCHTPQAAGDSRAVGRRIADVPEWLGRFYSRNLTADPRAGIGALSDEDLARAIRFGIGADGHVMVVMPRFPRLADDDIAAVIGFLRSGHADLAADATPQPPNVISAAGKLILVYVVGIAPEGEATGVTAPPRGPTAEYGRYVTDAVYQCGYCHTDGFGGHKAEKPGRYGGGFALVDPAGRTVLTANLTPHPTGLGGWTVDDFTRAVRDGVRPDGTIVRPPMPRMRLLDDVELAAMFAWLRTLPPVDRAIARPAAAPAEHAPEELFVRLGCVTCHGPGAPHADRLRAAREKPVAEVASWIRNPERQRPQTQMPTYASLLDEQQAVGLAGWVKEHAR